MYTGPNISKDGLVLSLDAANTKSYPRSGTTWSDLSGNDRNATLTNSPTFSTANGGAIVFNGSNYAEITTRSTALEFQPTQPYSVFAWFRIASAQSGAIVANMNGGSPFPGWDLWINSVNQLAMHLISFWDTNAIKIKIDINLSAYFNQWIYYGYSYDGSCPTTINTSLASVNFYINGSLFTTGKAMDNATDGFNTSSETITYNSNQRFRIASRWASGAANSQIAENVPIVQIYNRALTASEVLQNYNATKGRFGL
jgi:hypothetical protein